MNRTNSSPTTIPRLNTPTTSQRPSEPSLTTPGATEYDDTIERAWWMDCWLDKGLHFVRVPIASRITEMAGGHETQSNLLILTSTYGLQFRVGETLEHLAMKAFASASMISPSGANNVLPQANGSDFVEIHTDSSARGGVLGISSVFTVRDCSYSYAGAMIIDARLLLINYGEFVAATAAMLLAIGRGYRNIRINTDNESLVNIWGGMDNGSFSENVDAQLKALRDIVNAHGISVTMRHVKGHGVDFSNTMADGLAEMGWARPTANDIDLSAFGYGELRQAYEETTKLNERLEGLIADLEAQQQALAEAAEATKAKVTGTAAAAAADGDTEPAATASAGTDADTNANADADATEPQGSDEDGEGDAGVGVGVAEGGQDKTGGNKGTTPAETSLAVAAMKSAAATTAAMVARNAEAAKAGRKVGEGDARDVRGATGTKSGPSASSATTPAATPAASRSRLQTQAQAQGRQQTAPQAAADEDEAQPGQPTRQARTPRSNRLHNASVSINPGTINICRLLNRKYDHVSINRVDRLVAEGKIEKWEPLAASTQSMEYARSLVSDPSTAPNPQIMDEIWGTLAKKVAKKVTKKYGSKNKRSILVMRTMLVARLCGVPIEPSIDFVMENQGEL